ncbi:hypothetical protein AB4Y45_35135 [Paraburkholderia sp. EG287A]|uniref:hypothetical protein n=1 Tax=Paraburkholderia sp. EG287A TaxID=3237012 RepID=UPI0034D1AF24
MQATPIANPDTRALCQRLAKLNKVKLVGQGHSRSYARFSRRDGTEFEMSIHQLKRNGWPSDVQASIDSQARSIPVAAKAGLKFLRDTAKRNHAKLLDTEWLGTNDFYSFELKDGTTVKLRYTLLKTKGWPADPARTSAWAQTRAQAVRYAAPEELYKEFCECVERHGAKVITPTWQGARTLHEIRLADGAIRQIKPNQLKNYGWPVVPFDELQRLAGRLLLTTRRVKTESGKAIYRLMLPADMHLDAPYIEMRRMLEDGLIEDVKKAVKWARTQKMTFVPAEWKRLAASYRFVLNGKRTTRELPWLAEARALGHDKVMLSPVKRVATMNGLSLLSTEWKGEQAPYQFQRNDGSIFESTIADLLKGVRDRRSLERMQRAGLRIAPGYRLVSTEWNGLRAQYQWRTVSGYVVTASLNELEKFRREEARMIAWSRRTGIKLAENLPLQFGDQFTWTLPDGTQLLSDWPTMRNGANFVMRRKSYFGSRSAVCITAKDSADVRSAVLARQKRR